MKTIKELKKGDFFTRKPISEPSERQIWVRGEYDRSCKRYEVHKWSDVNYIAYLKGNQEVFDDFIF